MLRPRPPALAAATPWLSRTAWTVWGLVTLVGAGPLACNNGNGFRPDERLPGSPQPTTGGTSDGSGITTAGETGDEDVPCADSADCGGGFCAADHRTGEVPDEMAFICRDACVPNDFVALWCRDDAACCDAAASCGEDGFCQGPGGGSTTGTTGGGTSGGTGTAGTGGGTGTGGTGTGTTGP